MKSYLKTLGIVLILSGIFAQGQEPPSYIDFSAPGLPGKLYVPPEASGSSPRPIIIGLHGAGGIGSDNSRQLFDFEGTLDLAFRRGAFLYLPQSTSAFWHINNRLETIMAMVDKAVTERGADPTRIYLIGFSMGGGGTWDMLSLFPNRIAAAVPVASIVPRIEFNATEIAGIPIWAGHARDDTIVPFINTRNVLDALIDVSGEDPISYPPSNDRDTVLQYVNPNINLRYTEFPTGGHPVWPNLFSDDLVNDWLFDQKRELIEVAVNVTHLHFDTVNKKLIVDVVTDPIADVGIESSANLDSWHLDEVRVNTSGTINFETSVIDRFYRFRGMQ